jgi:hypothetical protein
MGLMYKGVRDLDLMLGLLLSIALGGVVGLVLSHPVGHVIIGSAMGIGILSIYIVGYSLGTLWLVGMEQGMVLVSAFVWCIILSSFLGSSSMVSSMVGSF